MRSRILKTCFPLKCYKNYHDTDKILKRIGILGNLLTLGSGIPKDTLNTYTYKPTMSVWVFWVESVVLVSLCFCIQNYQIQRLQKCNESRLLIGFLFLFFSFSLIVNGILQQQGQPSFGFWFRNEYGGSFGASGSPTGGGCISDSGVWSRHCSGLQLPLMQLLQ